jgi:hypothetical protein
VHALLLCWRPAFNVSPEPARSLCGDLSQQDEPAQLWLAAS